ncbi:MAG: hypothetical protein O7H39_12020 [Gammaproteobacteria bacterium]|nr:hypothetical protein [Gammaproteobacteria bacterium]
MAMLAVNAGVYPRLPTPQKNDKRVDPTLSTRVHLGIIALGNIGAGDIMKLSKIARLICFSAVSLYAFPGSSEQAPNDDAQHSVDLEQYDETCFFVTRRNSATRARVCVPEVEWPEMKPTERTRPSPYGATGQAGDPSIQRDTSIAQSDRIECRSVKRRSSFIKMRVCAPESAWAEENRRSVRMVEEARSRRQERVGMDGVSNTIW